MLAGQEFIFFYFFLFEISLLKKPVPKRKNFKNQKESQEIKKTKRQKSFLTKEKKKPKKKDFLKNQQVNE